VSDLTGIYTDLPNAEYHDMAGVSSSELKEWWKSTAHGVDYREEGDEWKPCYDTGNLVHDALLGDELEYDYIWYDSTKTRRAKTYKRECRDEGVIGIMPDDVEMIQGMRRQIAATDPIRPEWLRGGHAELSIFWRHQKTGRLLKVRPDYTVEHPHRITMIELKSVRERYEEPRRFNSRIAKADYELSASMYCDGMERLTGKPVDYHFIAVSKKSPYPACTMELDPEARDIGRLQYETAIDVVDAYESGGLKYRGYQSEPLQTDLPDWKKSAVRSRAQSIRRELNARDDR